MGNGKKTSLSQTLRMWRETLSTQSIPGGDVYVCIAFLHRGPEALSLGSWTRAAGAAHLRLRPPSLVCCWFLRRGLSSSQGQEKLHSGLLSPPALRLCPQTTICLVKNLQRLLSFACKRVALPGGKDRIAGLVRAFQGHLAQICHFSERQVEPQRRREIFQSHVAKDS